MISLPATSGISHAATARCCNASARSHAISFSFSTTDIFPNLARSASRTGSATRRSRCWPRTSACRRQRSIAFQCRRFDFARGAIPPEPQSTPLQGWKLPPQTHRYRLLEQAPHGIYQGGREWRVDASRFLSRRPSLVSSLNSIQARCASCIGTPTQMSGNMSLMVRSPSPCLAHMAASVSKLWGKVTSDTFRRVTATRLKMWAISLVVS